MTKFINKTHCCLIQEKNNTPSTWSEKYLCLNTYLCFSIICSAKKLSEIHSKYLKVTAHEKRDIYAPYIKYHIWLIRKHIWKTYMVHTCTIYVSHIWTRFIYGPAITYMNSCANPAIYGGCKLHIWVIHAFHIWKAYMIEFFFTDARLICGLLLMHTI